MKKEKKKGGTWELCGNFSAVFFFDELRQRGFLLAPRSLTIGGCMAGIDMVSQNWVQINGMNGIFVLHLGILPISRKIQL
jgi:hypothetical protein